MTYNEAIQPPETNGTIFWLERLLGAEFVRGRDCQGPSLSGAEMARNHPDMTEKLMIGHNQNKQILYICFANNDGTVDVLNF